MRAYRSVLVPAAVTLFSIVMMLIFPREDHIVAGTIFAVLFWLLLIITVLWGVMLVKRQKRIKARRAVCRKQSTVSGQPPLNKEHFQIRKDEESNVTNNN